MKIQRIKPEQTYPLRHKILRPHQSYGACQYDTDHEDNAFHIGAFNGERLVSVASFYLEPYSKFNASMQYRLRAMATMDEFRNRGAGRKVVHYAERMIKDLKGEILWCKGRTSVQKYYQKLGFSPYGEVFDYPPIGPHIIMYKELDVSSS